MNTTFEVQIHGQGCNSAALLEMIANHNNGNVSIDIDVLAAYCEARRAQFFATCGKDRDLFIKTEGENGQTISISEDGGKTFYLTITEVEK